MFVNTSTGDRITVETREGETYTSNVEDVDPNGDYSPQYIYCTDYTVVVTAGADKEYAGSVLYHAAESDRHAVKERVGSVANIDVKPVEDVHVYRPRRSYSDGLIFARATPDEVDAECDHLGTLDEFAQQVRADTGEFGDYIWGAEHAYWHEG